MALTDVCVDDYARALGTALLGDRWNAIPMPQYEVLLESWTACKPKQRRRWSFHINRLDGCIRKVVVRDVVGELPVFEFTENGARRTLVPLVGDLTVGGVNNDTPFQAIQRMVAERQTGNHRGHSHRVRVPTAPGQPVRR